MAETIARHIRSNVGPPEGSGAKDAVIRVTTELCGPRTLNRFMHARDLRQAFTDFFVERGHQSIPSSSLIPHDESLLFTNSGMVPFKSYFQGEEKPPSPRAVSIQKCVRAGGKHNDLDEVGRTSRHLTFFEMMGNFSFGDYFKETAIPHAWTFVTEVLGLDPERLWITVHLTDDEAADIWRREGRRTTRAHPASGRGQLVAYGRHGTQRSVLGDLLGQGFGLRPRGRSGQSRGRRAVRRDLESGLHAVRDRCRG